MEKKYTNHETHECYFRPRYKNQQAGMQQQQPQQALAYKPQGYGRGQTDKPQPVLGQQPPLPGTNQPAVVNFAQIEESPWEQMQALVPVVPYMEEEHSGPLALMETPGHEGLPPMHPP